LQLAIDLDQKAMEEQLGFLTPDSFTAAQKIYENGGNSKSYAQLSVQPLSVSANVGDGLNGKTETSSAAFGTVMESAAAGDTSLTVLYTVSEDITSYLTCRVGGLPVPLVTGCRYFLAQFEDFRSIPYLTIKKCRVFSDIFP
jgi:hypothetical protein